MKKEKLIALIKAGGAKLPADLIIENAILVNVLSSELYPASVAIYQEYIVATGDVREYKGKNTKIIDAKGRFLVPGLIDGHLHIECSKLSMNSFAKAVIAHGTTAIVSGLDQYLVIAGIKGVKEVLKEASEGPLKLFWGLPFKTPYTLPKSSVGFEVDFSVHEKMQKDPEVYGIWESVAEFVENLDPMVMDILAKAHENKQPIFGCAPMLRGKKLNSYICAGVRLDHESYDHEEAMEKIRKGMYFLIRESSISHFLHENIKTITQINPRVARRISFCTDDVTASELAKNGHLDKLVRMAIASGVDPITAIQMGSLNSAEAYRIDYLVGSIAPGKLANILIVEDLREFNIKSVITKGQLVFDNERLVKDFKVPKRSELLLQKPIIKNISEKDLALSCKNSKEVEVLAMQVDPSVPFVRKAKKGILKVKDGVLQADTSQDILYAAVLERFGKNANIGLGFVSGWGLLSGAMASSKAPDDNNIISIGTNTKDMSIAIDYIAKNGGAQIIVNKGKILAKLDLPICGICTDLPPQEVAKKEEEMLSILRKLGSNLPDPMFYMCCLQITAIPEYALTDLGAVAFSTQSCFDPILRIIK